MTPKRVFIVPYRNRPYHKFFFCTYMLSVILKDDDDYEIYFSHQYDDRVFNRGAMKNIGFLAVKNKYPNDYKDITFIFNDVDTVPFNKIFQYQTEPGIIKHYYGFTHTLGGIVVMKGVDFEKVNGFPCYWGWGMEDNALQTRCLSNGLVIDRSLFFPIGSPQILQFFDGMSRIISKRDPWREQNDNGMDGIRTIYDLNFSIDDTSLDVMDNVFASYDNRVFMVNVSSFRAYIPYEIEDFCQYDLRSPKRPITHPVNTMHNTWTHIPHVPTMYEKYVQKANELKSKRLPVPPELQQLIVKYKPVSAEDQKKMNLKKMRF